jgi:uncharacterized protein (UPF0335 family)
MICILQSLVYATLLATPALASEETNWDSTALLVSDKEANSGKESGGGSIVIATTTPDAGSRHPSRPVFIPDATTRTPSLAEMLRTKVTTAAPPRVHLSAESMEIVSGIIESFMHKVQLQPGEKSCLEDNVADLTGDVMGAGLDVVKAIKGMIPRTGANGTVQHKQPVNVVGAGLDGALKLTSLVTLCTQLVKNCVKGDALDLLKLTAHHLINMSFVVNRFVVNGVDIAQALSDGIIAYQSHHFHKFGSDIGTALRKILLSKAAHGRKLPEGVPEERIIELTTAGLMEGFFATGSGVKITDSADPRVNIALDLHRCIAGNSAFFKDIFMGLWSLIAQMSANKEQHGLDGVRQPQGVQSTWTNELMMAMAQFPMALDRCNVGPRTEEMLSEAIYSLKDLQVQIQFPSSPLTPEFATKEMAKAVEAWTKWKFEDFGRELGMLLRELVLQAFPKKYSVDAFGRLQRDVTVRENPSKQQSIVSPLVIAGVAAASFVALAAVRAFGRSTSMRSIYHEPASDSEVVDVA